MEDDVLHPRRATLRIGGHHNIAVASPVSVPSGAVFAGNRVVPRLGWDAGAVSGHRIPRLSDTRHLKVPCHPCDLEHPPEVRLGMHEGDGPVLDWKKEIHQHRQPR